jgi:hypothetical protein
MSKRHLLQWIMLLLIGTACRPGGTTLTSVPPTPTLPPLNVTFEMGGQVFSFNKADLMKNAGMTWVKRQYVYRQQDEPDLVAPVIQDAHNKGFKILLNVVGDVSRMVANPSSYNTDFATFLGAVALFNPDAIQVWNEPNIDREWPAGNISGEAYTQMLKAAYPAIKAANASVMVVSGAPAPTGFFNGQCTANGCDDNIFLQQMVSAGAEPFLDCIGIHYNEGILPPSATSGDPRGNPNHYTRYYATMVDLYARAFPNKPLCFDELGYLTGEGYDPLPPGFDWAENVTVQNQADWLAQAVSLSKAGKRVRLLIVWNVDSTVYSADPQAGYAIVRRNGSCPACAKLGTAMSTP